MVGMDAYTISSGIYPYYLQADEIISVPIKTEEILQIGYILNEKQELSELAAIYVEELRKYGNT